MVDQVEVQSHKIACYHSVLEGLLHPLIQPFFSVQYNMKGKLWEEFVSNPINHIQQILIDDMMP